MFISKDFRRCSLCVVVATDLQEYVMICLQMVFETRCAIRGRGLKTAQEGAVSVGRRVCSDQVRPRTLQAKGARYEDCD